MFGLNKKSTMPTQSEALAGRSTPMPVSRLHYVSGNPIKEPFPMQVQQALFGLGCFWGAEKVYWQTEGVYSTAVGYAAGYTPNPTYEEVCSGLTGHNEVVLVNYEEDKIAYHQLLQIFWQSHDPTQGMRQGNDRGTQYRSGIYTFNDEQYAQAQASMQEYGKALHESGYSSITTEIMSAPEFYYAEDYHQQYLAKNPGGYCGLGGTGISFPTEK